MGADSPPCRKTFVVVGRRGAGTAANQGSSPSRRHFWKLTDPGRRQRSALGQLGGAKNPIRGIPNISKQFQLFNGNESGPEVAVQGQELSSKSAARAAGFWIPPQSQLNPTCTMP